MKMYFHSELLGGHTDVDPLLPFYKYGSPFGQFIISRIWELECYDFDSFFTTPCRWRNERNTCDSNGDEMDFIRMKGSWGDIEASNIFGKSDKADGYFLITGSEQKLPPMYSAILASDPIQCQEGDAVLKLKFWTSPNVKLKVCIRTPHTGKRYQWCSEPLTRNNTKFTKVLIPGTIWYTFEIVIVAYNFTLDAFGKQGGAAIIDDISYNSTAIYECRMISHFDKLSRLSKKSCLALKCGFDEGLCLKELEESGWKTSDKPIGPRSSGIRRRLSESIVTDILKFTLKQNIKK
ncbi:hypothetical protein DICVIV_05105 [Dictyocaulus viviparus]|uniref:MAM domain-containing protein n=1 Tax=Dictyocaulus viviparus TaxID=29172 RepID=A0A0D8XWB5_DICVI|nr:hypothetical protein DICVIV_05105 [Dictyocaulus viviparus]